MKLKIPLPLLPLALFVALYIPFLDVLPYLDGNIDLVKASDFYSGGLDRLLTNWNSLHPPLKQILSSGFFRVFGVSQISFNLIGLTFGLLGIIFVYLLARRLTNKSSALIASFLFAIYPLYISAGIFSLIDFLLTVVVLGAIYFYSVENYFFYSLFAALAFLSKETGILLALAILMVEVALDLRSLFSSRKGRGLNLLSWILVFFPFLVAFAWNSFLKSRGGAFWQDWNFSEVSEKGSVYTIAHNLLTLNFLNKYAYQNWKELLILNFNWVYTLLGVLGIIFIFSRKKFESIMNIIKDKKIHKPVFVIILFCAFYFFAVLTFQTYTIPRYGLPLGPFLVMGASFSLTALLKKYKLFSGPALALIISISLVRLFLSVDPISIIIWGREKVLEQKVYSLRKSLAGNDGITYNLQYLQIAKKRSDKILGREKIIKEDCFWLFPDPNNENKMIGILSLDKTSLNSCKI